MFKKVPFVILVILVTLSESSQPGWKRLAEKRSQIDTRLRGGTPAADGAYPFMAYVYLYEPWSYCGGALISDSWVITSAACTNNQDSAQITLGTNDFEIPDDESIEVTASVIIPHPEFNMSSSDFKYNIALCLLNFPVTFTQDIQPIALAPNGTDPVEGEWVRMLGWDYSWKIMEELDLPLITNDDCRLVYTTRVYDGLMCASGVGGDGLCDGDMGSPLIHKVGTEANYTLHGIGSFHDDCLSSDSNPNAFSRITYFLDWIEQETGITP